MAARQIVNLSITGTPFGKPALNRGFMVAVIKISAQNGQFGALTMPSKSPKQARTMRAAAHDSEFAKKMGIPKSVAKEYVEADEKKKKKDKN
jgi:DNA-binding cell septation regulator SpoVG